MVFLAILAGLLILSIWLLPKRTNRAAAGEFPTRWRGIVSEKVLFYANLSAEDRVRFEQDLLRFIANVRITGVGTEVDITDKLLVARVPRFPFLVSPPGIIRFMTRCYCIHRLSTAALASITGMK